MTPLQSMLQNDTQNDAKRYKKTGAVCKRNLRYAAFVGYKTYGTNFANIKYSMERKQS